MPPPLWDLIKGDAIKGDAGSKQNRTSTAQQLDYARTEPQSRATTNRFGNAASLPTFALPLGQTRKRPAKDEPQSESNKRPRGSPNKAEDPDIQITATRKISGAFDNNRVRTAPSTPAKPSTGSSQYTPGFLSNITVTPFRYKHFVPDTVPVRQKPEFIDLTLQDGPTSPLASRLHKPRVVIDLTSEADFYTASARPQNPNTSRVLRPVTALEPTTPSRASRSAPSHNLGLPNPVPNNDLAFDLPRRGAIRQGNVVHGPETTNQGPKRPSSSHEEALAVPVSHERPAPVSRGGGADPITPRRDAVSDRSVEAKASNTDERPEASSHHGGEASNTIIIPTVMVKTGSAPKSSNDDVFVDDGQPLGQGEASEDSPVDDNDDGSDGDWTPCKRSRRSRAAGSSLPRSPRFLKPMKIVTLQARSEKARQFLVRLAQRPELPIGDKCFFMRLPLEVLQLIYRHLLRPQGTIQVLNSWSQLSRIQKREGLCPAILSVSRPIFEKAVWVLYAENVFQYLVRDTKDDKMVHTPSSRDIAVEKYARYFRNLELLVEWNRSEAKYGDALARGLDFLNDTGVCLQKLTINISPRIQEDNTISMAGWFEKGGLVNAGLKALNTCFVQIHLSIPNTNSDTSKNLRCIIDKRSEVSDLEVYQRRNLQRDGGSFSLSEEETRDLIRYEQAEKANSRLDQLSSQISNACHGTELAVQQEWFEQFEAAWGRPDYANQEVGDNLNEDDDYIYEDADA